jgi:hypothetical protein
VSISTLLFEAWMLTAGCAVLLVESAVESVGALADCPHAASTASAAPHKTQRAARQDAARSEARRLICE